jgi:diguanylate cyclase (GGDEF)-like protein
MADATILAMPNALRIVGSARLGVESPDPASRIGAALSSAIAPAPLLARLCATLSELVGAQRCIVVEENDPSDPTFAVVKEAFTRKEAIQVDAGSSILCVPLFTDRHTEGAIVLTRSATSPFEERDLRLLAAVAPQAAWAIHHARQYHRATSDGMTGLPNRQRFTVELEDAAADGGAVALILADLDNFHDKNDVYGRAVGDRALTELAVLLDGRLASAACIARTGDDEFGAVIPGIDAARAREVAEDLRRAVNDRIFDEAHEGIHLTISAGVAALKPGEMASSLFARAADALAAGKRAGRNRVEAAK